MAEWGFYGRGEELRQLAEIFARRRWFFVKVMGRRRIGKTALIREALRKAGERPSLYVQIPDSATPGVLSAVHDAMDTFRVDPGVYPRPRSLLELARTIGRMARGGYVVTLDEFQYFDRDRLRDFCSLLQAEVDGLAAEAERIPGGLIVLGSLHTEMSSLLEDRAAPLYSRTTHEITVRHLDIASILEILQVHADTSPERLLFLWNLFEGVPKFYRDCYEQGVLGASRHDLLRRIFFESSSPLRTEAENWFLKELHGRYDVVLKYIARHAGCSQSDLVAHIRDTEPDSKDQVGGYLRNLSERYALIERRLPIFANDKERKGRYYITDNFLRAWLSALASPVSAISFTPAERLIADADVRLYEGEGVTLEKLVAVLYEERSRKGIGDFALSRRVSGWWDRAGTEIDLVALDETRQRVRFGSCKRSAERLAGEAERLDAHVGRFLTVKRDLAAWHIERVCIAPSVPVEIRESLQRAGTAVEDLADLTRGL